MTEDELLNRIRQLNSVRFFDELGSTNDFSKSVVKSRELQLPFIIFTSMQTKGRGRAAKEWFSESGSLTFSLVLDANQLIIPVNFVSIIWGIVVAAVLNRVCANKASTRPICQIKWPNDIIVNEKKISGVLIETAYGSPPGIVIGCGININNTFRGVTNKSFFATSLSDETGIEFEIKETMAQIVEAFLRRCQPFLNSTDSIESQFEARQTLSSQQVNFPLATSKLPITELPASILKEYQSLDFLTAKRVTLQVGKETYTGNYCGINGEGAICIDGPDGLRHFQSGSIIEIQTA